MNATTLDDVLGQVFRDQDLLTRRELQRRIAQLAPPPPVATVAQALPEGAYDRYQAGAVMAQIQAEEGLRSDHPEGRVSTH